jgi:hypothetical protein
MVRSVRTSEISEVADKPVKILTPLPFNILLTYKMREIHEPDEGKIRSKGEETERHRACGRKIK